MVTPRKYDEEYEEPEEEIIEAPEPLPEPVSTGFQWIGDSRRPEAQESEDGMADLFIVEEEDDNPNDVVTVDINKDVLDTDEDGTYGDILDVTEDDVIGDEIGQIPYSTDARSRRKREIEKRLKRKPFNPEQGISRLNI